ncbi:uncharacterized protein LACBIDRAFT_302469 [Laccaria bicolor S238N-H82]|uniref:Predicted protein n=1 Tax=Laccaria bicolor (strain S238N-H82 / ATCC MYA-4686) TaxID=486041 RepID=B0DHQ2_LACBS|nr:uncharacterized protein LACBIDRAFT_302469 [Laccaria bicolor S238N-H82]EDR05875.1 predicted protein [Laccaria bicolor S238N-H82]|eukprot:XP_001883551.1 predicted protein [Laccaria bicolor S238N-H82]
MERLRPGFPTAFPSPVTTQTRRAPLFPKTTTYSRTSKLGMSLLCLLVLDLPLGRPTLVAVT